MKTKGLVDTLPELVLSLNKAILSLLVYLTRCLWVGHDLDEEKVKERFKGVSLTGKTKFYDLLYPCKHCGMMIKNGSRSEIIVIKEIKFKDGIL